MNDEPVYDDLAVFLATCGLDALPAEIVEAEELAAVSAGAEHAD